MENVKWKMVDGNRKSEFRIQNSEFGVLPVKNKFLRFSEVLCGSLCYVLLFLFMNGSTYSQSIDSLVAEAIRNNPQLKSLQYKITASGRRSESTNTLPPPNFSVEFSQVPTNSLNIINESISNNFAISQMFPIGGKLNAMAEVENKNTIIEGDNYDVYKVNLTAQLKMSYYNLWLSDRKIEVQQKQIDLINDLIKSVESAYYTNKINQADLLTLQSEIASNETQIIILQNQKEAERYNSINFSEEILTQRCVCG